MDNYCQPEVVPTQSNDLMDAHKALIAANEKYNNLVNSHSSEAEIRIAAKELSIAKARFYELKVKTTAR
ncbi:hypothetical protein HYY75_08660 [bacterium]|nr:hypothetical protein [bacterium]